MTAADLLSLLTTVSIVLIVFSTGMSGQRGSLSMLLRQPSLLFRSLLSMLVLAPLLAVGFATSLELPKAVKIALVMMAVSPVPPFLPKKAIKAGGAQSYVISLLALSAIVSIVTAPISLQLLDDLFGLRMNIPPIEIAKPLLVSVLLPLVAGLVFARLAPTVSAKWARIVSGVGSILLVAVVLPQLVSLAPALRELVGDGTLLATAGFAICTLFIGHLLGGPRYENRSVLALCTATRHPFIAIVLIQANFATEKLAVPAVFMALIVTTVASIPYVRLRRAKRGQAMPQAAPLPQPQSPRST
ncbi:MAG TPA: bile acid:sodium symporter [Gemmatimonadaceae bacterium]